MRKNGKEREINPPCPKQLSVFKNVHEARKAMHPKADGTRAESEDLDSNDENPVVVFPLEGGRLAQYPMNAGDLLLLDDDELKIALDACLEAHMTYHIPLSIAVNDPSHKDTLVERMERIYGTCPCPFVFVISPLLILEAPSFGSPKRTFEDYRLPLPDKASLFDKTIHLHLHYAEFKTAPIFNPVYTTLMLFSDYQFAFMYCRILIHRYFDVVFNTTQI